ncbi:ATP-binding protein [Streptomyces sp. NPDC001817]|uniref:ATP-binding protein n=1 Tax=Streptomyces sp. NPDC001817 TaxID=3154398 RepID=UPI003328FF66
MAIRKSEGHELTAGAGEGSRIITRLHKELPHHASAAREARKNVADVLTNCGIGNTQEHEILLVISEMVTNAVEHALPPISLTLDTTGGGDYLIVTVSDGGPSSTPGEWVSTCTDDEHGRGSRIVQSLAESTGVVAAGNRTQRWACLATAWSAF